jgi:endonuclease/exonuclease/phosphatase family metal-dependent hydrolase
MEPQPQPQPLLHRWGERSTSIPSSCRVHALHLVSFNILAPCYKVLRCAGRREHEQQYPAEWIPRIEGALEFLHSSVFHEADIVALQEYWFDDRFRAMLSKAVGDAFEIVTLRRTGFKYDGVAFLVRRSRFQVCAYKRLYLCDVGNRVGLALHLFDNELRRQLLVANTHLSFPHANFDQENQRKQVRALASGIDGFAAERGLAYGTPRLILGDFNAELDDPVCHYLKELGYFDCFHVIHASAHGRFVSHKNHRQEAVGVDHVFVHTPNLELLQAASAGLQGEVKDGDTDAEAPSAAPPALLSEDPSVVFVQDWYMSPRELPHIIWPDDFRWSDHRPVHAILQLATVDTSSVERSVPHVAS